VLPGRIDTAFDERPNDVVTMMLEHLPRRLSEAHHHSERRKHAVEPYRCHPRFESKPLSQRRAVRLTAPTPIAPHLDLEWNAGGPNPNTLAFALATETTSRALAADFLSTLTKALEHCLKETEFEHAERLVDQRLNGVQPLE